MQETSKQEHCFIPDEVEIERILQLPATQTNMRLCWQCSSTTLCIYGIMDSDKLVKFGQAVCGQVNRNNNHKLFGHLGHS